MIVAFQPRRLEDRCPQCGAEPGDPCGESFRDLPSYHYTFKTHLIRTRVPEPEHVSVHLIA